MKKALLLIICLSMAIVSSAQTYYEDDYKYLYDSDHRVVVRKCIPCTDDYQDLWNGDYVRVINGTTFIYRNGQRITYGDRIWLEHTGDYTCERGGRQYLVDSNGYNTGLSGNTIEVFWNETFRVERGDYWYLYYRNGNRMGSAYSTERIDIYWNGYYCYRTPDGYYRIADEDGDPIPNNYSEEEPTLTNSGYFRYLRSGRYYTCDTNGRTVY